MTVGFCSPIRLTGKTDVNERLKSSLDLEFSLKLDSTVDSLTPQLRLEKSA